MQKHRKLNLIMLAAANLVAAALMSKVCWEFYHGYDRYRKNVTEENKMELLRVVHFWAIPPLVLLTGMSGVLFWVLSREQKP